MAVRASGSPSPPHPTLVPGGEYEVEGRDGRVKYLGATNKEIGGKLVMLARVVYWDERKEEWGIKEYTISPRKLKKAGGAPVGGGPAPSPGASAWIAKAGEVVAIKELTERVGQLEQNLKALSAWEESVVGLSKRLVTLERTVEEQSELIDQLREELQEAMKG